MDGRPWGAVVDPKKERYIIIISVVLPSGIERIVVVLRATQGLSKSGDEGARRRVLPDQLV